VKNLKKLAAAIALMSVLGLTAVAGETDTPPYARSARGQAQTLPCSPGETMTPPCATAQAPTPGDIDTPAITQIATFVLQNMWSLF
jgi:hypothetical protein